jgi:uncharacterized DUF497 family protein
MGWEEAARNLSKHRVSFTEAARIFRDSLAYTYVDSVHSGSEHRYILIGLSDQDRILVVAHATRGEVVRIISARKATRRERRSYEEASK